MTKQKMASWWTPTGWMRALEPASYAAAEADADAIEWDFDKLLMKHGYEADHVATGDGTADMQMEIRRFPGTPTCPEHLLVETSDPARGLGRMFVAVEHIEPFWFDKYPSLMLAQRQMEAAYEMPKLRKAIIAFIRHGQGVGTIDETGWENKDDRERRIEWDRRRNKGKADAK